MTSTPVANAQVRPQENWETTRWTVVLTAAQQDSPAGQAALAALCQNYWYPVYAFIRRSGHTPEDAEDLTQGFFARLLERNWLASLTREGGKFRSVLLKAVKHHVINAHEHERALKRGGGQRISLEAQEAEARYRFEPAERVTPEALFEQRLAWQTLEKVLERLRAEYARAEKADLFEELKGFLSGVARPAAHASIAERHGISLSAVGVAVHRLRRRYGELLRQEVARLVHSPEDVNEELRYLIELLGRGRPPSV
jgi:RNA polymerase sigma factor (sigma-70 family)